MKISNETKVGVLTVISITLLILGFNYLKGKDLIDTSKKLNAIFKRVDGLAVSNAVMVNGLQIGTVYKMKELNADLDSIIVTINLTKDINIPVNSVASINKDLLGSSTLSIQLGNAAALTKDGDTLRTQSKPGMLDEVKSSLNPAINSLTGTLTSLDSLIEVVGTYFDPATKYNFQKIIANLTATSASLDAMINSQNSALSKSLDHVESITANLADNNDHISRTMENLDRTTTKLANAKIEETIANLESTSNSLSDMMKKANSKEGTLGLLLNDKALYDQLNSTAYKVNILLDDLRTHPKRYVNISVFGRKNTAGPLTAPLIDDSTRSK
ncbi:MAG TPA: MlaD family protein [Chitinophagaceae bacterium]|nr:MlaD family protein [Chitinophagaceae bacterium]